MPLKHLLIGSFAVISEAKLIGFMASVINKALKLRTLRKEKKIERKDYREFVFLGMKRHM